jgi:hypothetical protein
MKSEKIIDVDFSNTSNQITEFLFPDGDGGKAFLTVSHEGKIKIHTEDFPEWTPKDFAEEFVKYVHEISGVNE